MLRGLDFHAFLQRRTEVGRVQDLVLWASDEGSGRRMCTLTEREREIAHAGVRNLGHGGQLIATLGPSLRDAPPLSKLE